MNSAQIIELPGRAGQRVVQTRGPGRYPKAIINLWNVSSARRKSTYELTLIAEEIERVKFQLEMNDRCGVSITEKLRDLTDPKMTNAQRAILVEQIEFDQLPDEDRARIEAARAGRGRVVDLKSNR